MRRVATASRASRIDSRSAKAAAAPSRNVIASWISNSSETLPSLTPRPYSIGTSLRNLSSWPARRSWSASLSGAARKPSSALSPPRETAAVSRPSAARCERREQRVGPLRARRIVLGEVRPGDEDRPGRRRARPPRPRVSKPGWSASRTAARAERMRPSYVSSRSLQRPRAFAGVRAPASSSSSASVASAPRARSASAGGTRARAATSGPAPRRRAACGDRVSERGAEDRRPDLGTCSREGALVPARRPRRLRERAERDLAGRPPGEDDRPRRGASVTRAAAARSPSRSSVWASERASRAGRPPATARRGGCGEHEARRKNQRDRSQTRHRYCTILTFSRPQPGSPGRRSRSHAPGRRARGHRPARG